MFIECFITEFKGNRREYCTNPQIIPLRPGDFVIIQAERGEDMGQFTKRVLFEKAPHGRHSTLVFYPILRKATPEEIGRLKHNREREKESLKECKRLVLEYGLPMKLVDVEYQFDSSKITFYFTADRRVDFRALVRELAAIYRTRVELRQIGARDEARRIGGFGRCGLKQCCTTFINRDFPQLVTQLARDQYLPINPSRITGNCGRLLCCLSYEKDTYAYAAEVFPRIGAKYQTPKGKGEVVKIDALKMQMVVKLESGEEEVVTALDLRRQKPKDKGLFSLVAVG